LAGSLLELLGEGLGVNTEVLEQHLLLPQPSSPPGRVLQRP
jgi:hypothetical protein